MPITIKPGEGESQEKFIGRCMGNAQMLREFPKQDVRVGVCYSRWRKYRGGSKPKS